MIEEEDVFRLRDEYEEKLEKAILAVRRSGDDEERRWFKSQIRVYDKVVEALNRVLK